MKESDNAIIMRIYNEYFLTNISSQKLIDMAKLIERYYNIIRIVLIGLTLVYIFGMLIHPLYVGGWPRLHNVWDEWQALNVGILAFAATVILFMVTRYQADQQTRRELIANRAFMPEVLTELLQYCDGSAEVLKHLHQTFKVRRTNETEFVCLKKTALEMPVQPLMYRENFSRCISLAGPQLSEYLSYILSCMQIHNSRLSGMLESYSDKSNTIWVSRDVLHSILRVCELHQLVSNLFDYARGDEETFSTKDLDLSSINSAILSLKLHAYEDDLKTMATVMIEKKQDHWRFGWQKNSQQIVTKNSFIRKICIMWSKGKQKEKVEDSDESGNVSTRIKLLLAGIVLFALLLVGSAVYQFTSEFGYVVKSDIEIAKWGQFGDFFGGVLNPALSFTSLMALLFTIILQSRELSLSRTQLRKSADALKEQLTTQTKQRFENTFFSLLDQHNKILEKITTHKKIKTKETTDAEYILNDVKLKAGYPRSSLSSAKFHLSSHNDVCGHYFRVLYQLLKFIATNVPEGNIGTSFAAEDIAKPISAPDEKMYSNIVRSFINHEVTELLAINCYCPQKEKDTYWKFKLLIERYSLLEHLHMTTLNAIFDDIADFYDEKAFGGNSYMAARKTARAMGEQ